MEVILISLLYITYLLVAVTYILSTLCRGQWVASISLRDMPDPDVTT